MSQRLLPVVLLSLGLAACSGDPEQAPAPAPAPAAPRPQVTQPRPASTPPAAPSAPAAAEPVAEAPAAPAEPPLTPEQLAVGIRRDQLLGALGDCARRTHLTPASGAGTRTVESFQPKDAACIKKFGQRHFVVAGDRVHAIEPGLREEERPTVAEPEARDRVRPAQ